MPADLIYCLYSAQSWKRNGNDMKILLISGIILVIAFILALRSMKDFDFSQEIEKLLHQRKMKGTIVFFKDKIEHFTPHTHRHHRLH